MKPRKAIETSPSIHLLLDDSPPDIIAGATESGDFFDFLISKRLFNSLLFSAYYELIATSGVYSSWDTEKY